MTPLRALAKVLRSKNAGPFCLTFDVAFADAATFNRVVQQKIITRSRMAQLYKVPEAHVTVVEHPASMAIKATIDRPVPSGNFEDSDVLGAQQHAPLLDLLVAD